MKTNKYLRTYTMESSDKLFLYDFKVGMTCEGCSNAIKKLLGTEQYVRSYEISVPDKKLQIIAPDGIEA